MLIKRIVFSVAALAILLNAEAQKVNTGSSNSGTSGNKTSNSVVNTVANFTNAEAASAIKEALSKGVTAGVNRVGVIDGYFKNQFIKILFPPQAKEVETTLRKLGLNTLVDNMILSMNRAAEDAAKHAAPIFLNAIKQMTIHDAVSIVTNQQKDAATRFLERTTTEQLVTAFKPSIKTALDKSLATKYWSEITNRYNRIPFVKKVETDLPDYVTRKAISGLFYVIAQEEAKIRKDPKGTANNIIEKVFGSVKL
ncbi:MAG: DUF4197 domain-containing protein [Chitinophagales bacterium]|nr:DUF4197 domain-containing protein [Chitinophagales bacterium]MDW8419594.1 DUF4197 domain-containing protein [Chitinophagales bacterium]